MALHLSSLTVSHFRSHKVARLDLDHRPVALFGPNGAGKTNILEAVSLISPGRGLRRASAEDMSRKPETVGWKLHAVLRSAHGDSEIETWSEGGAARQVKIDGKASPQTNLAQKARVLWLVPSMDRLWIEGSEGRRRFLDRITMSFVPDHAQISLDYEKAMRERNRLLKDMVRDAHWYAALEVRLAETGIVIQANRRQAISLLSDAQAGAQTAFPVADLTLMEGDNPVPRDVQGYRSALADGRSRDLAAGRTLLGPHRSDLVGVYAAKSVPAKDCSTGEQKALLVSLILANARALAKRDDMQPVLLLDEVAAHLDADHRAALYDEICGLGSQAWMTGTETALFDSLKDRAQYFEVTDQRGCSTVVRRQI